MDEDVAEHGPHEEHGGGARIIDADRARFVGAAKVAGDDRERFARGAVVGSGSEREHERGARAVVKLDGDVLRDRRRRERDPFLGKPAQHDSSVRGIGCLQVEDALRQDHGPAHGLVEEVLLGLEVTQDRRGRDAEDAGDIGEGRRLEPFQGKDVTRRIEDLRPGDARWTAHL
jgi:hypothetical protein